ncbi:MAG: elongation factor 1-beta [Candidatus Aenigmatarchaeota archaeon]
MVSWDLDMVEVIVEMKIFPKNVEIDIDDLERKIIDKISPERIEKEPVAFGLVALKIVKMVKDEEGQMDELERRIREVEEVGEVEVINVTRSI